jgi:hypothetical protein
MDSVECTSAIQQPVNKLGSAFMMDGGTFARAPELGLEPGLGFYVLGRFGTLGRVHHDVVAASAAFFSPAAIAGYWDDALGKADPLAAAALFIECAHSWGRTNLASVAHLDRLNELATKVVDAAAPAAASLFAGIRALPRAADAPALAVQLSFALRELRMARHVIAVLAEGISPLEAILSGGGGEGNAKLFGWPAPFADVSALVERRRKAEQHTNELHAADLAVLTDVERADLASAYAAAYASLS